MGSSRPANPIPTEDFYPSHFWLNLIHWEEILSCRVKRLQQLYRSSPDIRNYLAWKVSLLLIRKTFKYFFDYNFLYSFALHWTWNYNYSKPSHFWLNFMIRHKIANTQTYIQFYIKYLQILKPKNSITNNNCFM